MSEPDTEHTEATESLEAALARNFAAAEDQTVSTDTTPDIDSGDVTANEDQTEIAAGPDQESEDALDPPEKWTDVQKDSFRNLSRDAQQILLDRHRDVESYLTKETQSLSDTRKRYEKLDEVLKPYNDALRPRGIDLEPHLANALQYYFAYQQNPVDTLKSLMESAGVTQDQFFEDQDVDPSIRALRTELQEAKREIANLKSAPQERESSSAQKMLDDFKSATKEDGSPKYPHFEQLKSLMAPLVNDGKSLEDAYGQVLWTLPEYQQEQLKAIEKKAADELEAKRKEKTQKAKKASDVMPSSDVSKATGLKPASNWTEALEATLSQMK